MTHTILLADDERHLVNILATRCQALKLKLKTAADGDAAVRCLEQNEIDVAVLDLDMPGRSGLEVRQWMLDHDRGDIPTIVLTGSQAPDVQRRCRELRAEYVPKSAAAWKQLEPRLRELLNLKQPGGDERHSRTDPLVIHGRVLCIDDDRDLTRMLQLRLRAFGLDVLRAHNGIEGFSTAVRERPDVIITDFSMSEGLGSYVLGRLRDCKIEIPVIFLSGMLDGSRSDIRRQMLEMGAQAVLSKPVDFARLTDELRRFISLPSQPDGQGPRRPLGCVAVARTQSVEIDAGIRALYYPADSTDWNGQ